MIRTTAVLAGMIAVCGMLMSGCEKKEAQKPAEQKAGEQAPAKKSPVGC